MRSSLSCICRCSKWLGRCNAECQNGLRMLKKATFSLSQPWRLLHPPALSLPRQTLRPGTRLGPGKAAAGCYFTRGGWDDPNCAQYSTHPALSAPRRALSRARAFQFPLPPFRGVAKAALNCAHRTSTVLSCAFCEQGGHLAAPSPSFGGCASTGIVPATPPFFSILFGLRSCFEE